MACSQLHTEKLGVRLTPDAKRTLQQAAALAKRSVSEFGLDSALTSAAETLADRRSFALEPEQWEAFLAALDAPVQCYPRMSRLLLEASVFERDSERRNEDEN